LSDEEWDILKELWPLLDHFLEVTKIMSQNTVPLVHQVIPYMDVLTTMLNKYVNDDQLNPAAQVAACRGCKMLD
ncbi:hypothetical protein K439DRAFT_1232284, partial [Ramaria rubella]